MNRDEALSLRFSRLFNSYGALFLLIALMLFNIIFTQNFANINILWNLITQGTVTMVVALGMTFAISSGGIDLSVGSVMVIAAMVTAKSLEPMGVIPAILLGLLVAVAVGFFNGIMISVFGMQPFIATLAMYISGRGIAQLLNDSMIFNFTNEAFISIGRNRVFGIFPTQLFILAAIIFVIYILVRKTAVGRYVQAIGDNKYAARLCGVSVVKTTLFVYGMSALLAGLAGILEIARIGATDPNTLGKMVELDAIAAVVLGGTPMIGGKINYFGTVFAALVMQLIVITFNMNNISAEYAYVVKSLVLVITVVIQQRESLKR